jgi:UPF0755 protein
VSTAPLAPKSPREAIQPEPAAPPPPSSRHAKRQWVVIGHSVLTLLMVLLVVTGGTLWLARKSFTQPGPLGSDKAVFIPKGSGVSDIADTLARAGVISSVYLFIGAQQVTESKLQWGEYMFPKGASMAEVLEIIRDGKAVQYQMTFPEGLTTEQIIAKLAESDILTGDVVRRPGEGTLLPETYKFHRGESRQSIINKMEADQKKLRDDIWKRRAEGLPLRNVDELVTLASIVEKETGKAEERARVAAVFMNRLTKRMRLQSDPTIIYGIVGGKGALGRSLMRTDIDKLTPYNTYQIDGLPPTPIGNPGRAAMEAVANPARSREVYFVADGTGGHVFAETLDQHNRNVARWRQVEKEQSNLAPAAPPAATGATPVPSIIAPDKAGSANAGPGDLRLR